MIWNQIVVLHQILFNWQICLALYLTKNVWRQLDMCIVVMAK